MSKILICLPPMLPNLATMLATTLANKFRSKDIRDMFVYAHFCKHLLFYRMLSNVATMLANNSTHSDKSCKMS